MEVLEGIEQSVHGDRKFRVIPILLLASGKHKEVRPMNKKQNHISVRQGSEKAAIRDEQNRRI